MTHTGTPAVRPPSAARRRGDLWTCTALCGALIGFAVLTTPALATPVLTGAPQVNAGGGAPTIAAAPNLTNITLHGARTVIDWASYDVANGETVSYAFGARNWIVLNRIGGTTAPTIAGVVEGRVGGAYGGNIWFSSKNGMIFGSGAQIDAGGILVSAATPDLAGFLDPNNLTFNFSGAELINDPLVGMQAGSSINGHGGLVAMISPAIVTEAGTSVTGQNGSNVLYGVTHGYQLRLAQGAPGDFDLVDFIIPASGSGSGATIALDLQNTTTANSVFVAMVSRSSASSAVINLQGMITAQAATADGGDIILSGNGGIVGKALGPSLGGTNTDIYLHLDTAARDITLQTGGQVFGKAFVRPPPPPPITKPLANGSCNPNDICAGEGSQVASTGRDGLLIVTPSATLHDAVDPKQTSSLTAARDITLVAGDTISLGVAKAARDLSLDGGAIQANDLTAGRTLTLKTEAGGLNAGALSLGGSGAVTSAGAVQIDGFSLTGAAGQILTVQAATDVGIGNGSGTAAGGVITLTAGHDVNIDMASATFDTVTAGGAANLQAGTLKIGTVKAQQILAGGGSVTIGSAISDGDVYVSSSGGKANVGTATAGDDVYVLASGGDASLTKAVITGAGPDTVGTVFAGNPDQPGNGHVVAVQSADGNALLGLGAGSVTGATKVSVQAGQDATVDLPTALPGTLSVIAARDATLRAPTVVFDAVQAGRDITLTGTVGDFSSTRALVATRNISIAAAGALSLGDITAASGSIALTGNSVSAGNLVAGQDLTLKALSGGVQLVSYKAGRDLAVQGASLSLGQQLAPIGRDLSITTPNDFTAAADLTAGRNLTLTIGGAATLKGVSVPGTVDIIANDLTLGGAVTAANVQVESATGALRVGGSAADGAPASGLWLDNAEFGRIHATGQVNLYAGAVAGTARGDLTVLALDVTPQSTPQVNFLVGGGHNALVQGVLAPTASGGVIHIGDSANAAWQPTSILVSGTLGSASYSGGNYSNVRAFDHALLFATQDIVIGSQRFIGLIQSTANADIEIGKNKPLGVAATGAEQNRVLVAAGDLELSATGKVVSQNTASTADQSVGLFLTGKGTPNLILDPPQLVDLYGAFVGKSGAVLTSFSAGGGVTVAIVDAAGNPTSAPAGSVYRFNSCAVDTGQCSAAGAVTSNLQQNSPVLTSSSGGALGSDLGSDGGSAGEGSGGGASSGGKAGPRAAGERNAPPSLLSVGPVETEKLLTEPVVTGAGSEEIWRKRQRDDAPTPASAQSAKP